MKRARIVRLLSLLLVQLISILLLTVVNVGVPSPVHASDVATLSPVYKAFSNNMGGMVYEAHVIQASASFDGSTGFGGNSPQIYLSVLASLNNKFVGTPEPWYNIHKLRISVTIRDSSQNVLNPQESVKYTIGYNMWDSPYTSATDQDYANEFYDMVKYFQDLELGLVIPYPIPDLSSIKLPQPFNGVAKDTSSIWAQWATYPDSLFQAQGFPYSDPYHSIKLLVQPNFPKPDVYSISVSVLGERGSCDIGLILGPTTKPYICSADETLSTAYSFNYVYQADAGVDSDASNNLPNSGGTPRYIQHGSYTGFLYGTDTADVYSFAAYAGEKIVFTVTPPSSADFGLAIYDPSQNSISSQDLGTGATNAVSFTASASSTYFARISLGTGWGTYYFTLSDTFQISANPSAVTLGLVGTGSSATSTVSIASPTDFSGRVDLATSITPSVANGPTTSLSLGTTTVTQNPSSVSPLSSNPTSIMGYPVTCTRTLDKAFVQDGVYADFIVYDGSNTNTGTPNPCGAQYSYSVNIPTGATITAVQVIAVHQEDTYGTTLTVNVSPGSGTTQFSVSPFPSFSSWATTTLDVTAANMDFSSGSASVTWTVSGPYGLGGASRLDWLALRVTYKMTAVNLTPGSSDSRVLTIASSTSTPAGVYIVSVTGTSGVVSFSTTVLASVTDFQVSANPVSVVILPGQTSTTSIMAYGLNGFTGTISLTDTYSSGLFCSGLTSYTISLTSTSTSGTSSVSCNGPPGSYSLTVTGSSGSQSRTTAPVALNVSDFVLTANPTSLTFPASSSANTTIDVISLNGFRGLMNLTYSTPPGLTCDPPLNIEPDPISMMCWGSPGSYTVTVTATSGAALGSAGGSLSHTVKVPVTVQDFTISASQPPVFVAGSTGTSTITVSALNGFTGTVTLSYNTGPSGVLFCSLSSAYIYGSGSSSLSCSGLPGTTTVNITGTSGSLTHSTQVTFTIKGFTLTVTPSTITVPEGRTSSVTVKGTSVNGYSGTATLSASIYCGSYTFSKPTLQLSPGVSDSATLSITPSTTCNSGTWYDSVGGNDAAAGTSASATIIVTTQDFSIGVQYPTFGIRAGTSITNNIYYYSDNGYSGNITQTLTANQACCWNGGWRTTVNLSSGGSAADPLSVTATSAISNGYVTMTGTDGYITRSVKFWMMINDYNVTTSPANPYVYIGGSGGTWLQIFPYFGIPLTNSTIVPTSVPSCLTVGQSPFYPKYFNIGPVTPYQLPFVLVNAASNCVPGNYQITVTITGVTNHAYDKAFTFTISVQTQPSGGGGGSVAHGTLVTLLDGSQVPVQNLKVGDILLGYDPATGQYGPSMITTIKALDTSNMLVIQTAAGTPFRVDANPAQTLWAMTGPGTVGWVSVTKLKVGDYLLTRNGWVPVTGIQFAPAGQHTMYDITSTTPYFASGYLDPIRKL